MTDISKPTQKINQLLTQINSYLLTSNSAKKQIKILHEMRITTRTLIALSPPESYQTKLFKRIMQSSNQLRDIDVFVNKTLPDLPENWQSDLQPIYQSMNDLRESLDIKFKLFLETELQSELEELQLNFAEIFRKSTANSARLKLEISDIEKSLKKQLKLIQMVDIEDKHLHKIRLKIKRLNYQLEHFYPQQKITLSKCIYLQHELGHFHDLCQAINLLKKQFSQYDDKFGKKLVMHLEKRKQEQLQTIRSTLTENKAFK